MASHRSEINSFGCLYLFTELRPPLRLLWLRTRLAQMSQRLLKKCVNMDHFLSLCPHGHKGPAAQPLALGRAQGSVPAWWRCHCVSQHRAAGAGLGDLRLLQGDETGSETLPLFPGRRVQSQLRLPSPYSVVGIGALLGTKPSVVLPGAYLQGDATSSSSLSRNQFQLGSCHFHFERFQKMSAWMSGI